MPKNNIIQFKRQKLFKNARLVDIENASVEKVDILVDGERIARIAPKIEGNFSKVEDLHENFVMPAFVNMFCNSDEALLTTYGLQTDGQINVNETSNLSNMFKVYGGNGAKGEAFMPVNNFFMMKFKNYLAGAVVVNDFGKFNLQESGKNFKLIQNLENLSETELDLLFEECHQKFKLPFLKIGKTLEELGTIDKLYKKTLPNVLEDFGFLDLHPVIVGGNCFEKDELELLKQYDCIFIVTPFEDGKLGIRPTNLYRLKNMDFQIGLGSGNTFEIDFFEYMRLIIMQMRSMFESEEVFSEQDALKLALLGTTKLVEGDLANFIVVRNDNSLYDNILKTLVWEKNNHDLIMTVDEGEIVQKNGEIAIQDMPTYDNIKMMTEMLTRRNKNDD